MRDAADEAVLDGLRTDNARLRARLEEAEDTLRAIREGEVDAIIVSGSQGDRVFSLTETENLHRQMVETMNEAGLAISPDGLLVYCNERAAALLGRPRGVLLGRRLAEFVASQDGGRLQGLLAATARGMADDRVLFRAGDGRVIPLHLWASQLQRPEGPLICLVGTDLSRLEAERALVAQLQEQQQALSASRAEALDLMAQAVAARESAAQAAQELREADRRKDVFLATLAHELRNPLAPIRNALDTLRLAMSIAPEVQTALAVIERQFAHLVRLLDDLLDVSRITRGKIDLRKEPVELATVLASAVETVQPLIAAAGQRLTLDLPPEPLWIEADPVRLGQVFGNLLNNATKYTSIGGEIRLVAVPADAGVWVSVRDTGIGIPAVLLPHVFELFRQGAPDHLRGEGGLGIGLSLVKRLTELHGGRVEVLSPGPGQGTEFRVFLPAMTAPPRQPPAAAAGPPPRLSGLSPDSRILIVDDNRDAATSLASLLTQRGGRAEVAFDGPAALERFDRLHPDLVILDIGMPGMDGHEVARRIRARADRVPPILIAMSGLGQEADRRRSFEAGCDAHLVKPVSLEVLDSLLSLHRGSGCQAYGVPADSGASATERGAGGTPRTTPVPRSAADREATRSPPPPEPEPFRVVMLELLHDLAQPLNTAACYAVAARNWAGRSVGDSAPLYRSLRGIDQQLQQAGMLIERLRACARDADDPGPASAEAGKAASP